MVLQSFTAEKYVPKFLRTQVLTYLHFLMLLHSVILATFFWYLLSFNILCLMLHSSIFLWINCFLFFSLKFVCTVLFCFISHSIQFCHWFYSSFFLFYSSLIHSILFWFILSFSMKTLRLTNKIKQIEMK